MARSATVGRIRELDVLRGIAICAVVGVHVGWDYAIGSGLHRTAGRIVVLMHLLCGFAVPLFFALSAAGLALGYDRRMSARSYFDFLRRRALQLLPGYLAWSVVSIALFKPRLLRSPRGILHTLLTGTADAQFYYVPLVFELYVLWPAFQPVAHAARRSKLAAAAVATLGIVLSLWWWRFSAWRPVLHGTAFSILAWLMYACLGIAIAHHTELWRMLAKRKIVIGAQLAVASVIAFCVYRAFIASMELTHDTYLAVTIFQPLTTLYIYCAIFFLGLLVFRHAVPERLLLTLAEQSYGIYLIHYLVLRIIVYRIVPPSSLAATSSAFAAAATTVAWLSGIAISSVLVAVALRFDRLRPLVTNRR